MGTAALWVLVVVIPASALSLLVLDLDVRAQRRRPRRPPLPSRLTAVLGAALGAGGFGLASLAGVSPAAHAAHGPEQLWVASATAGGAIAVAPVDPLALAQLPFAPVAIWGTGFDGAGTWDIVAEVPGAADVTLASGNWPKVTGDARHRREGGGHPAPERRLHPGAAQPRPAGAGGLHPGRTARPGRSGAGSGRGGRGTADHRCRRLGGPAPPQRGGSGSALGRGAGHRRRCAAPRRAGDAPRRRRQRRPLAPIEARAGAGRVTGAAQ